MNQQSNRSLCFIPNNNTQYEHTNVSPNANVNYEFYGNNPNHVHSGNETGLTQGYPSGYPPGYSPGYSPSSFNEYQPNYYSPSGYNGCHPGHVFLNPNIIPYHPTLRNGYEHINTRHERGRSRSISTERYTRKYKSSRRSRSRSSSPKRHDRYDRSRSRDSHHRISRQRYKTRRSISPELQNKHTQKYHNKSFKKNNNVFILKPRDVDNIIQLAFSITQLECKTYTQKIYLIRRTYKLFSLFFGLFPGIDTTKAVNEAKKEKYKIYVNKIKKYKFEQKNNKKYDPYLAFVISICNDVLYQITKSDAVFMTGRLLSGLIIDISDKTNIKKELLFSLFELNVPNKELIYEDVVECLKQNDTASSSTNIMPENKKIDVSTSLPTSRS